MPVKRRAEIQWLRALAAVEIIIVHSDLLTKHFSDYRIVTSFLHRPLGGIGVELFFVVSGFVICTSIPASVTSWQFFRSRILRLYPMYWFFTTLVLVVYFANSDWRLSNFELSFPSLLKSYLILPQSGFPILGVGWTLEHEMMFYAFVAIFMLIWKFEIYGKLAVAWWLAGMGFVGAVVEPGSGFAASAWASHIFSPYMFAFGAGWLLRCNEDLTADQGRRNVLLFVILGAVAFLSGSDLGKHIIFRVTAATLIFSAFVWYRQKFDTDSALNRFVWQLGDASFSIYLSHWFVLSGMGKLLGALDMPSWADGLTRVCGVVLSTAIGLAIFLALERPVDRVLRKKPRSGVVAPVPVAAMARPPS